MSYPFSNTFEVAPPADYLTVMGSMSATYNSAQQSIDISAPTLDSILRFNEPAHGDFWFEADLELLADPSGRKHVALWMLTGNGAEGYRFAHLDGGWDVQRWHSNFIDRYVVASTVNDGARPISGLDGVAPAFNVGQRRILRCEVIVGAFDANGVPWARIIHFKADGVLMFQVLDATYRGKLIPGVFLYGATARIHSIAGGTPSGLPAYPSTVGARAPALGRLQSPSSDLWDQPGPYACQIRDIPAARRDTYFGGTGKIYGTVKVKGTPDLPLARKVQLLHERSHAIVAETWSDAAGNYQFTGIDPTQRYTVVSYDHEHMYRAVIADNLTPEVQP